MLEENNENLVRSEEMGIEPKGSIGLSARLKEFEMLSIRELVEELKHLVLAKNEPLAKNEIEEVRNVFLSKYEVFIKEKHETHLEEIEEVDEESITVSSAKKEFDTIYQNYKNESLRSTQANLAKNLEQRIAIVEELKALINNKETIKDAWVHFNELRERWKNAGPIPKDKYNHVWNNYHFHIENFYDYLHLDREARDIDFKHNLELKQKIITRLEELIQDQDISKAFRELQDLHRIWKEDIGPVSKEYREEVWNKFSDLTKQIHDKRELLLKQNNEIELENFKQKQVIIAQIENLSKEQITKQNQWIGQLKRVEELRQAFLSIGRVPSELSESIWANFKKAVKDFNSHKNSFYKDIKKEQNDNFAKKQALLARANELKDNIDFESTTPLMTKIQEDWKKIGHVPRKYSDTIWKDFKDACNHYFERFKNQKNQESTEEIEAFEKKKLYMETIREFTLIGDHKIDLENIKKHIENWKKIGKVPYPKRHIDGKFNKILDALFEKLSLSKKDTDMMRFSNRVNQLLDTNDIRKIESEKVFLMRKIEDAKREIFQLENNIQFFSNAKKENSIVLEVRKSIAIHKENLEIWKEKLKQIRSLS